MSATQRRREKQKAVLQQFFQKEDQHPLTSEAIGCLLTAALNLKFELYHPLVLLHQGSLSSPIWDEITAHYDDSQKNLFWYTILQILSVGCSDHPTHLALLKGIPAKVALSETQQHDASPKPPIAAEADNILRSPTGMTPLYGGFGPESISSSEPTSEDLASAFWVSHVDNRITQIWAPRWTMFSRGNIKEKLRLYRFHDSPGKPPAEQVNHLAMTHRERRSQQLLNTWAVDLYGGIGYFTFVYAKLSMRVLCWELNPWSVEGMRRGAKANKWKIKVVQGAELHERPTPLHILDEEVQIVIFLEDNREAKRRIEELRVAALSKRQQDASPLRILHVNGGLLPTSISVWKDATDIVQDDEQDGWLHLHENVGKDDVNQRAKELQNMMTGWCRPGRSASVEHIERVKTFAPGVWHCVFDVYVE